MEISSTAARGRSRLS